MLQMVVSQSLVAAAWLDKLQIFVTAVLDAVMQTLPMVALGSSSSVIVVAVHAVS
jgi:hypothetical protein